MTGSVTCFTKSDSQAFWGMGNPAIMVQDAPKMVLLDGRRQEEFTGAAVDWCTDAARNQDENIVIALTSRRLMIDEDGDPYFQELSVDHPTYYFQTETAAVAFKLTFSEFVLNLWDPSLY